MLEQVGNVSQEITNAINETYSCTAEAVSKCVVQ